MSSGGPTLRAAFLLSGLFACSVGEVPTNHTGPDGGAANDGGASGACVARITPAGPAHTHTASGGSNAGLNCVAGGCHLPTDLGDGAPPYQYAGTVYLAGTRNPNAGATVQLRMGSTVIPAITDEGGNFSFPGGTLTGTFSATVVVSACPSVMTMPDALVSGGDPSAKNCNGCHGTGGPQSPITL